MNYIQLIHDNFKAREYEKLAYKTIISDLLVNNVKGIKRAVDLEYWSDEDSFASYDSFIPGNFYVFLYESKEAVQQGNLKYHDRVPVMLTLGVGQEQKTQKKYVYGLNFNLLPGATRAVILQEIHDIDSKFFDEEIYKSHTRGEHVFSKAVLRSLQPDGGVKFIKYLAERYNINKNSFAFRRYYLDKIKRYRMIDVWQWKFLPFLEYREGVRGAEIKKIQAENASK